MSARNEDLRQCFSCENLQLTEDFNNDKKRMMVYFHNVKVVVKISI